MKEFLENYFEPIRDLFFKVGIKRVTMDNVCSELGISKRTLYQKFNDKNHLVKEIFYKDFQNFKSEIKSAQRSSSDAINETCMLFKIIDSKQEEISSSTLYDLKKYYYLVSEEISMNMNQLVVETFSKIIERGILEGHYCKNVDSIEIAGILSCFFNSFILKVNNKRGNSTISINSLLDYHLNSICSQQGKAEWEKLKNEIIT
jgi:AcrR family transcriptional regulator